MPHSSLSWAEAKTATWRRNCSQHCGEMVRTDLATLSFTQPRNTCPEMAPPTMDLPLRHQSLIKKTCPQPCLQAHLMETIFVFNWCFSLLRWLYLVSSWQRTNQDTLEFTTIQNIIKNSCSPHLKTCLTLFWPSKEVHSPCTLPLSFNVTSVFLPLPKCHKTYTIDIYAHTDIYIYVYIYYIFNL